MSIEKIFRGSIPISRIMLNGIEVWRAKVSSIELGLSYIANIDMTTAVDASLLAMTLRSLFASTQTNLDTVINTCTGISSAVRGDYRITVGKDTILNTNLLPADIQNGVTWTVVQTLETNSLNNKAYYARIGSHATHNKFNLTTAHAGEAYDARIGSHAIHNKFELAIAHFGGAYDAKFDRHATKHFINASSLSTFISACEGRGVYFTADVVNDILDASGTLGTAVRMYIAKQETLHSDSFVSQVPASSVEENSLQETNLETIVSASGTPVIIISGTAIVQDTIDSCIYASVSVKEISYLYPVQTGTDLYIPQIFSASVNGSELML